MARDISKKIEESISFPHLAHLHAIIRFSRLIRLFRKWMRLFDKKSYTSTRYSNSQILTEELEKASEHYRKHGWVFVDNVFSKEFHEDLVRQFPKRHYMEPPKSIIKSYDTGFRWLRNRDEAKYIEKHPAFETLLKYFRSSEFGNRITKFADSPRGLTCKSFLVNKTYPGSLVIAHKDERIPEEHTPFINIVFFLDGTGGNNSGELIFANDNEYKDVVFTPPNIKNSCLIYDTNAPLYHGFKPVAFGKYRLAATAAFASKEFKHS